MAADVTETQAFYYAGQAGFQGLDRVIAVAIAEAESGLNSKITNTAGNSAGVDRGIMQINSYYHPEVSNAQAFDPQQAFNAAYKIYQQSGNTFKQWATYINGNYRSESAYKNYAATPSSAPSGGTSTTTLSNQYAACIPPSNALDVAGWVSYYACLAQNMGQAAGSMPGGVGGLIGSTAAEPITALAGGIVAEFFNALGSFGHMIMVDVFHVKSFQDLEQRTLLIWSGWVLVAIGIVVLFFAGANDIEENMPEGDKEALNQATGATQKAAGTAAAAA